MEENPFFLLALTPLHIGSARLVLGVDLPFIRDEYGFPYIPGSSVKGALRAYFNLNDILDRKERIVVFGSEPENVERAGAVIFTDYRLVAIPARLLLGVWGWITSYSLISAAFAVGGDVEGLSGGVEDPGKARLLCGKYSEREVVINEEYVLQLADPDDEQACLIDRVYECPCLKDHVREYLRERPIIQVSDIIVRELVERSMLIVDRVGLNYKKKIVERGPWSEEYVPQFTVFRGYFIKNSERIRGEREEEAVRKFFEKLEKGFCFTLGGKETVGKGVACLISDAGRPRGEG